MASASTSSASDLYGLGVSLLCAAGRCAPSDLPLRDSDGSIDVARVPNLGELAPVLHALTRFGLAERCPSARVALARLDHPTPAARASFELKPWMGVVASLVAAIALTLPDHKTANGVGGVLFFVAGLFAVFAILDV